MLKCRFFKSLTKKPCRYDFAMFKTMPNFFENFRFRPHLIMGGGGGGANFRFLLWQKSYQAPYLAQLDYPYVV